MPAPEPIVAEPVKPAPEPAPEKPAVIEAATAPGITNPAKPAPPLAYGGVMFDYTILDNTSLNTLNYTNQIIHYFEPSWALGKFALDGTAFSKLMISGRLSLTNNLAGYDPAAFEPNGDLGPATPCSTVKQSGSGVVDPNSIQRCETNGLHRSQWSDVWLTAALPRAATIPETGIHVSPSFRLILPTSLEAQFATLNLATALSVNLSRAFLADTLTFGFSLGGTKYWHRNTTPLVTAAPDALGAGFVANTFSSSTVSGNSGDFYADPARAGGDNINPQWGVTNLVSVDYAPVKKLSFSVLYIQLHSFSYDQGASCPGVYGGLYTDPCAKTNEVALRSNGSGAGGRHISDTQIFWATVNYQVLPWFGLSLAWINAAPLRHPDNSLRQPFVSTDYNAFTNVSLGATFQLNHPGEEGT
jgi:hypothetical protein